MQRVLYRFSPERGELGARFRLVSSHAHGQSTSRRRAEAALWRAAEAEGLAQSKSPVKRIFQKL